MHSRARYRTALPLKVEDSPGQRRGEVVAEEYREWSKANKKPCSYGREETALGAAQVYFSGQKLSDIYFCLMGKTREKSPDRQLGADLSESDGLKGNYLEESHGEPEISPLSKAPKAV